MPDIRSELTHYQLSPRVQIVVGDIVKVNKGTYYNRENGTRLALDKLRGEWKVTGIFKNADGDTELDIVQHGPVMIIETATIRVTGKEYPSPVMKQIIRRPYKIRLASPRTRRRRGPKIESSYVETVEDTDWEMLANIVKENEDA